MYGDGVCPFIESISKDGTLRKCIKSECELWDEYETQCSINLCLRVLRLKS
jgi:hypothetical protein